MVESEDYADLVAAGATRARRLVSVVQRSPRPARRSTRWSSSSTTRTSAAARARWEPRELPTWVEDQLWGQVVKTTKLAILRSKRQLTLRRTDTGDEARVSKGSGSRVVTGLPSELALYVSRPQGRRPGRSLLRRRQRTG